MTEDLVKVAVVKMKKKRWTEHSYLMELDGSKKRKRWKNDGSKIFQVQQLSIQGYHSLREKM